jgi:UDP-N-acetylglucosamine acyltransferase
MSVHPTAVVHPSARLGDVEVGPFAVIGADVELADGVQVGAHAVIEGPTRVGPGTVIHAHAALGGPAQDTRHDGSPTRLLIGARNVFREFVTVHRGSSAGRGETRIGDDNYFMANSHVAHDCVVGNGCTFANSVAIAGHVEVDDHAVLGGLAAVHQHCRVGRFAMVGGGAMCAQDVPPFTLAQGDRARLFGLNVVGLKRAGFSLEVVSALKGTWRVLFTSGLPLRAAIEAARAEHPDVAEVDELITFIDSSARGVCRAASGRG